MMRSLYLTYADDLRPAVCGIQAVRIAKNLGISSEVSTGVANAARTRDLLNHNQMLYQLSYSHHVFASYRSATDENYTRFSSYVYIGVLRVSVVGLRCGLFIM